MTTFGYSPLLTDLYQLTMAYGYWKLNMHEQAAAFHILFRKSPFKGNYALCCGLESVIEFIQSWRFQPDDLAYLATLKNSDDQALFPSEFLAYLATLKFSCDMDAMPEGTIAFPQEPLIRIEGPILQCQLLESSLLNIINFQTLIATKASRVVSVAGDDPVIEFGMRRAQGPNGALSASRASYVGGCASTSNTLAGKLFDIPVRGTHAHSWVTAFPDELAAFEAYASVMPHNCILLVDTYNTLEGVANAIKVGNKLKEQGALLLGIRLDSGDMAELSIKARQMLDEAGFPDTVILASNSLNEYLMHDLKQRGAKINAWGVGTHLATAYDQPALDGVYKLAALKDKKGEWQYKLKLSEEAAKISNPGRHQVRRFFCNEQYIADVIYDIELGIEDTPEAIIINQNDKTKRLDDVDAFVDLLQPIYRQGELVKPSKSIHQIRDEALDEVKRFHSTYKTESYAVGIEKRLFALREELIEKVK